MDNFLSNEPYRAKIGHSWRPMAWFKVEKNFRKFSNFQLFSKFFWFFSKIFSKLKLSHRAPRMSDFCAIRLIRQEIIHTFFILFKHGSPNYLHTCGTQKAHHAKNAIFVPVVCSSSCAWCVHILGGANHLKVQHQAVPTPCPDLKSDKNSSL